MALSFCQGFCHLSTINLNITLDFLRAYNYNELSSKKATTKNT